MSSLLLTAEVQAAKLHSTRPNDTWIGAHEARVSSCFDGMNRNGQNSETALQDKSSGTFSASTPALQTEDSLPGPTLTGESLRADQASSISVHISSPLTDVEPEQLSSKPYATTVASTSDTPLFGSKHHHSPHTTTNPSHNRSPIYSNNPVSSVPGDELTSAKPWNHVDSSPMQRQEAPVVVSKAPHPVMPSLTNEQQMANPDSIWDGPASEVRSPTAHKRDYSATVGATSSPDDALHSRDAVPFGLRNKKMKPTDCLLYAATLLSKEDDTLSSALGATSRAHIMSTPPESPSKMLECPARAPDSVNGDDSTKPRDVDVLCGRGGLINKHFGNVVYRKVVDFNKPFYQSVHKKHRILVSQSIVQSILNFGGRFLILGAKGKSWIEIGYKRAVQKTSQALRERSLAQDDDDANEDNGAQLGEDETFNGKFHGNKKAITNHGKDQAKEPPCCV